MWGKYYYILNQEYVDKDSSTWLSYGGSNDYKTVLLFKSTW